VSFKVFADRAEDDVRKRTHRTSYCGQFCCRDIDNFLGAKVAVTAQALPDRAARPGHPETLITVACHRVEVAQLVLRVLESKGCRHDSLLKDPSALAALRPSTAH
jgi:hypothetical protein